MEEIEITSNRSPFSIFIPKECDLDAVNRVVIRGREYLPVVHGEWINESEGYIWYGKCSICNHEFNIDSYYADMNYCPNCGAKMDGKEQDDE